MNGEPKFKTCQCERCGHVWVPRDEPKVCPKCKSPYWNVPRKREPVLDTDDVNY